MKPPWVSCPEIPSHSIGWRMGYGEAVYETFHRAFSDLPPELHTAFVADHPEPPEWGGFYQSLTDNPWPTEAPPTR